MDGLVVGYYVQAKEICSIVMNAYEIMREDIVRSLKTHSSLQQGLLVERISKNVADVFSGLCVLGGFWLLPAATVFVARRVRPILPLIREFSIDAATEESVLKKWNEVKEEYKKICFEEISPALLVVFTVDTLFCSTIGVGTFSVYYLLRAFAVSLPTVFSLYKMLLDKEVK